MPKGGGTDWFEITAKILIPGMLILAVIGVLIFNAGDIGGGSIFKDIGGSLFNLGGP
jgi:hypothetical protein